MSFWQQHKSPLGYVSNGNKIDTYGVDHSGFTTRDELQYQNARINRENNLMTQMQNQGITDYPQLHPHKTQERGLLRRYFSTTYTK